MVSDYKVSLLSNLVAKKLVWQSVPIFEKAATLSESYSFSSLKQSQKIWGVTKSIRDSERVLELFVPIQADTSTIRDKFKKFGVPIKFIRTKGFESYFATKPRQSITTGNPARHFRLNGWGTLGGYVDDKLSNLRLAISNNHVFGNLNRASINDRIEYDTGAGIIQIGGFRRMFPLLPPPDVNNVDAAVAWVKDDINLKWIRKKPRGSIRPRLNMEVYKIGATTGYTEGFISSIALNHRVKYHGAGIFNFVNSIVILGKNGYPFSLPGDSGSLVFKKSTHEAVGMIFAGDGTYSFANSFKNIESLLQISI
ncbi:MAG: hypothetical protein EHM58_09970 [Ignavibacteriae bacterium]|nr:MAG: hypothetical protein EHM58_09970 [Ignavibacteriota bacterium]